MVMTLALFFLSLLAIYFIKYLYEYFFTFFSKMKFLKFCLSFLISTIFIFEIVNSWLIQKRGDQRILVVFQWIPKGSFNRLKGHNFCK